MANLTHSTYVPLATLLENIDRYRYNPSNIQRVILNHLAAITNGAVDIVDPTSPFVFLLEASAVNGAAHFAESEICLRKQYPVLAQTAQDIYPHMSEPDFADLFATPATANFTFLIQYTALLNALVDSPEEHCQKATIARNTEVTVDGITFSLQYPIDIRRYDTEVIQISYDTTQLSPLQTLQTNVIRPSIKRDASNIEWLYFTVELTQFKVSSTFPAIQSGQVFKQGITYTDSYHYCRVFYKRGTGSQWVEMATTLTDQVYDPLTPTAVISPNDQTKTLTVFIPPVYMSQNMIDGSLRIDVYQTHGALSLDTSNFTMKAFSTSMLAVDEDNDITAVTNAMNTVSLLAYSSDFVNGGTNALSFTELRNRVINNSIGNYAIPITNVQLATDAAKLGFAIVKNVDTVTNRKFLATQSLPQPTNSELITPANVTINTFITDMSVLAEMDSVVDNGNRMTILSKTLYKNTNGKITVIPQSQVSLLKALSGSALCTEVNAAGYLYSPFYYVLDNSGNEFEVRAYHLDMPTLKNLSFISQNASAGTRVNTNSYAITKTDTGYQLAVEVVSDTFYKALGDAYVQAQLCYLPTGEINKAYINGVIKGTNATTGERVFTFDIQTNHDIDALDKLTLTNFEMFSNEFSLTTASLVTPFTILYATTSVPLNFVRDATTNALGSFLLPPGAIGITQETIDVHFGTSLNNLWAQSRSVASGLAYETYATDIPMVYTEDDYAVDPALNARLSIVNGKVTYELLHHKGDVVLDAEGGIVYQHRAGDVKLDNEGHPTVISDLTTERHLDILMIDGSYYFTTDSAHIAYRRELSTVMNTWITDTLVKLQALVLEKTEIHFYPTSAIGLVSVMLDQNNITTIEAKQAFQVTLYVSEAVHKDMRIRTQLSNSAIRVLNDALKKSVISISDIITTMKATFGSSVISFKVTGLGGAANYETITMIHDNERLSLNKVLVAQDDGTLIVKEDVAISFAKYTAKN